MLPQRVQLTTDTNACQEGTITAVEKMAELTVHLDPTFPLFGFFAKFFRCGLRCGFVPSWRKEFDVDVREERQNCNMLLIGEIGWVG